MLRLWNRTPYKKTIIVYGVGRGRDDGRIKGREQSSSDYVYYCQGLDYNGKMLRLQGTFVLIRQKTLDWNIE